MATKKALPKEGARALMGAIAETNAGTAKRKAPAKKKPTRKAPAKKKAPTKKK